MSGPIKPGDLVMVVRWPHRHATQQLGKIFLVERIADACHCAVCWETWTEPVVWTRGVMACPAAWVKRIPPLSELERETREEEVHA